MYVEEMKKVVGGRTYSSYLLRESYREGGKVKKRTVGNISHLEPAVIEALKQTLSQKSAGVLPRDIQQQTGPSFGALYVALELCKRLGITEALGKSRMSALVHWLIFARLMEQGSRLSSTRMAQRHEISLLGLKGFDEDDLYAALDWLAEEQEQVQKSLFARRKPNQIFLYDVSSSYFEGAQNDLAWWGYNRDGKKGKKQLVFGMVADEEGEPIAVETFPGNTADGATFVELVKNFGKRFGVEKVTFVGDRGMIKSLGISAVHDSSFNYITAITKPQIRKLLKSGVFQIGLFEEELHEVIHRDTRFVMRRNPVRAAELASQRNSKLESVKTLASKQTSYLSQHSRASEEIAANKVKALAKKLCIGEIVTISSEGRIIGVEINKTAWEEAQLLDGCYVLKTDLPAETADKTTVHTRYKDLAKVESGFRTMKTTHLELRPIWLRRKQRTKAHVFVCMLAYKLYRELDKLCLEGERVSDLLEELKRVARTDLVLPSGTIPSLPNPPARAAQLLKQLGLKLPYLPYTY